MAASLLTCSGASVGVSISTQRRMPSRMVVGLNGLEDVAIVSMLLPSGEIQPSSLADVQSGRPWPRHNCCYMRQLCRNAHTPEAPICASGNDGLVFSACRVLH